MEEELNELWLVDVIFTNGDGATFITYPDEYDDCIVPVSEERVIRKMTVEIFESVLV